jgi:hypothetical protein
MPNDPFALRQELLALLGRIVGTEPLPPDLQRKALAIFAGLLQEPDVAAPSAMADARAAIGADSAGTTPIAAAAVTAVTNRRLIYVHGICRHVRGFSDAWWNALHRFVPNTFGEGVLEQTRLEVIWSDIVNQASVMAAVVSASAGPTAAEQSRQQTADAIKDALRDRADQHVLHTAASTDGRASGPIAAADIDGLISIPGLNCIDDFSIYLTDAKVRQQILDRFIAVVKPALQAGLELDIVAHSWGTVVAYEALRQLEDEGLQSPLVRNFFTVGAALSIGPVKRQLRGANKNGKKPASVRRWVNLNAHGDIIGGALKGRPYDDDVDILKLEPFGCNSVLGLVNPTCAHGSYFESGNVAVNRDIFANYIGQP